MSVTRLSGRVPGCAQVVGGLLDAEAPDDFINNLILSVRSLIPVEQLCAEVRRAWLPLLPCLLCVSCKAARAKGGAAGVCMCAAVLPLWVRWETHACFVLAAECTCQKRRCWTPWEGIGMLLAGRQPETERQPIWCACGIADMSNGTTMTERCQYPLMAVVGACRSS